MLTIKRTTLLPINCYYSDSVLAKNEAVLILIPRYTVFSVYRPTLLLFKSNNPNSVYMLGNYNWICVANAIEVQSFW